MRKLLSVILAVALVCVSALGVRADSGNTTLEPTLEQLAQQYILVEVTTAEDEEITVYSELEVFYSAVYKECPSITDTELAWFTIGYTKCEAYNHESCALEILGAKSITLVEQYVVMGEESGVQAYSSLDSVSIGNLNDAVSPTATETETEMDFGVALFTYDVIERDTVITESGVEREYYVCVRTDWLDMPMNRWVDTLGIAYTGALDDSQDIISGIRQSGCCAYCGREFFLQEGEEYNSLTGSYSKTSSYLEFDYSGHAISTKVTMKPYFCYHISGGTTVDYYVPTDIYAYLGFTVLISEVGEMRVAYAHSTLGVDASISATVSGGSVSVDFSPSLQFGYQRYICAPRTLHITQEKTI